MINYNCWHYFTIKYPPKQVKNKNTDHKTLKFTLNKNRGLTGGGC